MDPVKIVVRFSDGRIKKGYSQDFFPNKAAFHLVKNQAGEPTEPEKIQLADLKAVFFVNSFDGNPDYTERKDFREVERPQGRKAKVTFADGEIMQGSVLGYDPKEKGFFLFPVDPGSNNLRIFVVNASVKKVRFSESEPTPSSSTKSDYQCLVPETQGKLLMLSGEERNLLKLVLLRVMNTDKGKEYIIQKLGKYYLQVGYDLMKELEKE